ncbi:MAG: hypothetical protein LC099_01850 [Anaerolineales bacterium]|nr:hypothetical protein [Anaerolineales bacterium]
MTKFKFPFFLTLTLALVFGISSAALWDDARAQDDTGGLFVTVVSDEPEINVRMGPNALVYPVIGKLARGATAPALGRSQGGDWVQIKFAAGPNGKGWVYAPLVEVSPPGNLQIVDAPPTPLQPPTSTIDPTLAAQFIVQAASTRLPTYTPAPTLSAVHFDAPKTWQSETPWAPIIVALTVLGMVGFLLSLLLPRR